MQCTLLKDRNMGNKDKLTRRNNSVVRNGRTFTFLLHNFTRHFIRLIHGLPRLFGRRKGDLQRLFGHSFVRGLWSLFRYGLFKDLTLRIIRRVNVGLYNHRITIHGRLEGNMGINADNRLRNYMNVPRTIGNCILHGTYQLCPVFRVRKRRNLYRSLRRLPYKALTARNRNFVQW